MGSRKISPRLPSGHWSIILILAVAAILRLQNITEPFIDVYAWREASVAMMAENFYRKSWNIFYPEVNWVGPTPGYQGREFQTVSFISALLYTVFGQHDWIGRAVSIVFGVIGIFATYQLTRRVWDEQRALAAATLMAVLPGVVRLERSFLPDPAMVALVTTSFWMLTAYLQTDKSRYLILAAVVGIWGGLTKLPGLIIGLPMVYATLSILSQRSKFHARRITNLSLVGVLSALPIAAYYLWARHIAYSYPPHHFAGEGNWLWDEGLALWIEQKYFIFDAWGPLWRLWSTPAILLLCLGMLLPLSKKWNTELESHGTSASSHNRAPWLFHWWVAGGLVFYFIGARELVGNSSNFHVLTPAVAALSSSAIIVISSFAAARLKRPVLITVIALLIIIAIGIREWRYTRFYSTYAKESYQLGLALNASSQPDDLVITLGNVIGCPVAIYYSGRRGWLFPPHEDNNDENQLPNDAEAIATFERLRAKGANWFGVVNRWRNDIWKERPNFAEYIEQNCELIKVGEVATICRIQSRERTFHRDNDSIKYYGSVPYFAQQEPSAHYR